MVVLHLHIDSRDAMGANLVNAICEHIAPLTEQITGGRAVLRILSNLTDRAVATASVRVPSETLAGRGMSGEEVRDGIIVANEEVIKAVTAINIVADGGVEAERF